MKKRMLVILAMVVLLCVAFGACSNSKPTEIVTDGETTILQHVTGKPADYDAKKVAYAAAGRLEAAQTYRVETEGSTRAKKGMIDYTQNISNFALKNVDEAFAQSVSSSTFANVSHQAFVKSGVDKVVYRGARSGDLKVDTTENYRSVYGVIPGVDNLGGWVLNDESILYAERVDDESTADRNVYHYVLDKKLATGRMSAQMKTFGGLKDYPTFDKVELSLVVKDDFTPVSLTSVSEYDISISVLGKMSCKQSLTAEYSEFGTEKQIPDAAAFNAAVGKTPTHEVPVPPVSDPVLEGLVSSLVEYDIANGVALRGNTTLNVGGAALSVPLEGAMKFDLSSFDPADFAKSLRLSVSTELAGMPLALHSLGDGNLYIDFGSTRSVFDLDELGLSVDASDFDFGAFVKVSETADGYSVALSKLAGDMLDPVFEALGFRLNRAEILFAVSGNRTSAIELHLGISDPDGTTLFALDADMMLNDRAYASPDPSAYTARSLAQLIGNVLPLANVVEGFASYDWTQGKRIDAEIDVNLLYPMQIPVTIDLKVNPDAATLPELVNAKIRIDLSTSGFQNLCALAGMFGSAIFPVDVNFVDLYYTGDGNLYTALGYRADDADGEFIRVGMFSETALGDSLNGLVGNVLLGALTSGNNVDLVALLGEIVFGFTPEVGANTTTLTADDALLSMINAGYSLLVDQIGALATAGAGDMLGGMVSAMLDTELTSVKIAFDTQNGAFAGLSVAIDAATNKAEEALPYLFRFSVAPGIDLADGTFDDYAAEVARLKADEAVAAPIRNGIAARTAFTMGGNIFQPVKTYDNLHLFDSVGAEIAGYKQEYREMTATQRAMVYNYSELLAYEQLYLAGREKAQTFADLLFAVKGDLASWTAVNEAYAALTDLEKDYLGHIVLDYYAALRDDFERANGVAELSALHTELLAAIAEATTEAELTACGEKIDAFRNLLVGLLPESQLTVIGTAADAQKAAVSQTDTLERLDLYHRVIAATKAAFDALPATLQQTEAYAAAADKIAQLCDACDEKTAVLLDPAMTAVTEKLNACNEQTTAAQYEALGAEAAKLATMYRSFFDAEYQKSVTAHEAFATVYPSVVTQGKANLTAAELNTELDALIAEYKDANTSITLAEYYEKLNLIASRYSALPADAKNKVTHYQSSRDDYDTRANTVYDAHYAALLPDMQAFADAYAAGTADQAAGEALLVDAQDAMSLYSKYFATQTRNLPNYNEFSTLYYGAFRIAVYSLRAPDLTARVQSIADEYRNAETFDELNAYKAALDAIRADVNAYENTTQNKLTAYRNAKADLSARLKTAINDGMESVVADMRAALAKQNTAEALGLEELGAITEQAELLDAAYLNDLEIEDMAQITSYPLFLSVWHYDFQGLLNSVL